MLKPDKANASRWKGLILFALGMPLLVLKSLNVSLTGRTCVPRQPSPALRQKFDALLKTVCPGGCPPPSFRQAPGSLRRPERRNESVWTAYAFAENNDGVTIVLNAETGELQRLSCTISEAAQVFDLDTPIHTDAEARAAARRALLRLEIPVPPQKDFSILERPSRLYPHQWLIEWRRGNERSQLGLYGATGRLLSFIRSPVEM